jgi:hypothetical protein
MECVRSSFFVEKVFLDVAPDQPINAWLARVGIGGQSRRQILNRDQ